MTNYYKILKVKPTATKDDIKLSYRQMVQKYHPDKIRNNLFEEKFKEINEAYHILIDENKRHNFDKQFLLYNAANGKRLIWIYIFVLIVVFCFILRYLSNLSLNFP